MRFLLTALVVLLTWAAPIRAQSYPQELLSTWVTVYEEWGPNRIDSLFYHLQAGGRYSLRRKSVRFDSRGWTVRTDTTVHGLRWVVQDRSGKPVLCLKYRVDDICQEFWFTNDQRRMWLGIRAYNRVN